MRPGRTVQRRPLASVTGDGDSYSLSYSAARSPPRAADVHRTRIAVWTMAASEAERDRIASKTSCFGGRVQAVRWTEAVLKLPLRVSMSVFVTQRIAQVLGCSLALMLGQLSSLP
jgi:hypothetical protein